MKTLLRSLLLVLLVSILSVGVAQPVQAASNDTELLKQGVTTWAKQWSSGDDLFTMDRVDDLYEHSDHFLIQSL